MVKNYISVTLFFQVMFYFTCQHMYIHIHNLLFTRSNFTDKDYFVLYLLTHFFFFYSHLYWNIGSLRHSVISSVTTVSSSRDELLEAYENAKRAQMAKQVLYERHPDSSSQPTDSSSATEPGIREFTQSPPKPDERREASCEVPPYERELRFFKNSFLNISIVWYLQL